jgi:hypothetical protein
MIRYVFNQKGNVATLWVASLPAFAILFMVIASLASAWMTHSASQVAADAASLAATKKLDGWVQAETNAWISRHDTGLEPDDPGYIDPYTLALGNDAKRNEFMHWVIARHESELKQVVKEYVTKHGGHEHGEMKVSVNGQIEVNAQSVFRSLIFEEAFQDYLIAGSGTGPKRYYLDWMTQPKTIPY